MNREPASDLDTQELELDRLRLENAKLRGAWWRRGAVVLALGAMAASIAPVTSAIRAKAERDQALALQASQQQHALAMERTRMGLDVRDAYIERLDTPEERLRALRFLAVASGDAEVRTWAEAEKAVIEAEQLSNALRAPSAPRPPAAAAARVPEVSPVPPSPSSPAPSLVPKPTVPAMRPKEAVRPLRPWTEPSASKAEQMALKDDPY